jgi:hypothetical protein
LPTESARTLNVGDGTTLRLVPEYAPGPVAKIAATRKLTGTPFVSPVTVHASTDVISTTDEHV